MTKAFEPVLKPKSGIDSTAISAGQMLIASDTGAAFVDTGASTRMPISDWVIVEHYSDLPLAPVNKIYFVTESTSLYWPDSSSGTLQWKLINNAGVASIGTIFAYPLSVPPVGAYLLNGQTITDCEHLYPQFWGWIQAAVTAGTVRTLTSVQYESEITTYGQCGAFVISGSNIRLPLINGFIQGLGTGTDKGITIAPGLPNITGNIYNLAHGSQIAASADGAFTRANGSSTGNGTGGGTTEKILFDASRSSSIYGNSNTVQPPAIKYSYCIQVFNAATELSQQESAQIATALQGKADKNLGNIDSNFDIIRAYNVESDGSWVRIWKSGWVEQGGFFTGGQSVQISFLVQFSNVNYTVSFAQIGCTAGDKAANSARVVANTKLAASMTVCCGYATGTAAGYDTKPYCWYACGQGNPSSINQYISEL